MSTIDLPPVRNDDAGHFVSTEPFDPGSAVALSPEQERLYLASQWKLMWWKFQRHRVAVISGVILLLMYGSTLVSEILAPYNLHARHTDFIYASPQRVHLFHDGHFIGPFVYAQKKSLDMTKLRRMYTPDRTQPRPLRSYATSSRLRASARSC